MNAARVTAMLFAGTLLAACSPPNDSPEGRETPSEPERFARLILPYEKEGWVRESMIPTEPQESPAMVIWEVTAYPPRTRPTPEQRSSAADLVERCHAAALRHGWLDFAKGGADGFKAQDRRHFRNEAHMLDDLILDPDHPEILMYYPTPEGQLALAGFMFFAKNLDTRGPQLGGPLTIWHYHSWKAPQCLVGDVFALGVMKDGKACKKGTPSHRSAEMMHVWLLDHPGGPFASSMILPADVLLPSLEKRIRERGY